MTKSEFAPIYRSLKKSGLSRKAFSEANGLKSSIVNYWCNKFENENLPLFEEISNAETATEIIPDSFHILHPSGMTLCIPNKFETSQLKKILEALQ